MILPGRGANEGYMDANSCLRWFVWADRTLHTAFGGSLRSRPTDVNNVHG